MVDSLQGLRDYLKKYASLIEDRKNNIDTSGAEFQIIKQQSVEDKKELSTFEGEKEINRKKNRYRDILPFDHSRIVLTDDKFSLGSDYINANCIKDHAGNFCYIASQGPMPYTVDDFWRMIWQYKVKVIIMACKEVEMGKPRCQRYWPPMKEEATFNTIKVKMENELQFSHNIKLRELVATKDGKHHSVSQLHFSDWPDHGAPETTESIVQLVKIARQKNPGDKPPILVHCSAGCGRTGAIIALDYAQKLIKARAREINVMKIVTKLRKQRAAMVQTKEQYEFLYEVIRELVTQELTKYDPASKEDDDALYVNMCYVPKNKPGSNKENTTLTKQLAKTSSNERKQVPSPRIMRNKELSLPTDNLVNLDVGFKRSRSLRNHESNNKNKVPPLPRKSSEAHLGKLHHSLPEEPALPPKSPKAIKSTPIAQPRPAISQNDVKMKSASLGGGFRTKPHQEENDNVFYPSSFNTNQNTFQSNVGGKNNVREGLLVDLSESSKPYNKPVGIVKPYAIAEVGQGHSRSHSNTTKENQMFNNSNRNVAQHSTTVSGAVNSRNVQQQNMNTSRALNNRNVTQNNTGAGGGWKLSLQSGDSNYINTRVPPVDRREDMYSNPSVTATQPLKVDSGPPVLPQRTPESFIIVKNTNESTVQPPPPAQPQSYSSHHDASQIPSATAKHWYNAISKMKNIGKKQGRDDTTSISSTSSTGHQKLFKTTSLDSYQVSQLGFPKRLSQKPRGPRPPPAHWDKTYKNL